MDDPDSAWNSLTIRLAKWRCSSDVIVENPWFGVGTGDEVDELLKSYKRNNFLEGIRCRYNSHNQYLSVLIAVGLTGLLIFIFVLLLPFVHGYKKNDHILVGFIILITIFFWTENVLSVQKGVVFFSFFYALLIKKTNNPDTINTIPLQQ
jgi:O-antigen ligase